MRSGGEKVDCLCSRLLVRMVEERAVARGGYIVVDKRNNLDMSVRVDKLRRGG